MASMNPITMVAAYSSITTLVMAGRISIQRYSVKTRSERQERPEGDSFTAPG